MNAPITINQPIASVKVIVPGAKPEVNEPIIAHEEPGLVVLPQVPPFKACGEVALEPAKPEYTPEVMGLHLKRPRVLPAMVYKISSPHYQHSFYLTLADIILNEGTPFEERRPWEMFLNTQNTIERGWIEKNTLDTSFLFRTGLDVSEQIQRWKRIEDPKGGWMRTGPGQTKGSYIGSLQAEIACYIEHHINTVCVKSSAKADEHRQAAQLSELGGFVEYEQLEAPPVTMPASSATAAPTAKRNFDNDCRKCGAIGSVVMTAGCPTCSECGDSKCG